MAIMSSEIKRVNLGEVVALKVTDVSDFGNIDVHQNARFVRFQLFEHFRHNLEVAIDYGLGESDFWIFWQFCQLNCYRIFGSLGW